MDRYDTALIAIAISKNMKCDDCPYPCSKKKTSSMFNCERHWNNILGLLGYNKEKAVYVDDIDNVEGLEGQYVVTPKFNVPVYIPRRTADGVPILPKEFSDD